MPVFSICFSHARDRAYTVPQLGQLAGDAGLRIVSFVEPAFYDPRSYLTDPKLLGRLEGLSSIEQCALAELLAGNMRKHVVYVVPGNSEITPPDPGAPNAVPVLRDLDGEALAKGFKAGASMTATVDGIQFRRPLPPLAGAILRRINGRRRLAEIQQDIEKSDRTSTWDKFSDNFSKLYSALNVLGKMYLRFG